MQQIFRQGFVWLAGYQYPAYKQISDAVMELHHLAWSNELPFDGRKVDSLDDPQVIHEGDSVEDLISGRSAVVNSVSAKDGFIDVDRFRINVGQLNDSYKLVRKFFSKNKRELVIDNMRDWFLQLFLVQKPAPIRSSYVPNAYKICYALDANPLATGYIGYNGEEYKTSTELELIDDFVMELELLRPGTMYVAVAYNGVSRDTDLWPGNPKVKRLAELRFFLPELEVSNG